MRDEDSQEPIVVEYGGRITPVDFVFWPALGLLPALAMVPAFPRWLAYVCLGLGVLTTGVLMAAASIAFTREHAWIEGARIQISLMIGFFVIGQMMVFASGYYLLSSGVRGSFSQALTPASAVYFSVTAWTTTGFGDIHPATSFAQILVICELLCAVLTVTVILATAVTKAFAKRKESCSDGRARRLGRHGTRQTVARPGAHPAIFPRTPTEPPTGVLTDHDQSQRQPLYRCSYQSRPDPAGLV